MRNTILVLLCLAALAGCQYFTPHWGTTTGPQATVEKTQVAAPTEHRDVETIRVRIKRAGGGIDEENVPLYPSAPGLKAGTTSTGGMVVVPDTGPQFYSPFPAVKAEVPKPKRPWWDWCGITQGCKGGGK